MDFNTEENKKVLIDNFPLLSQDQNYELLSEPTPVYNCIAWAMGFNDRWVAPAVCPGNWWPKGVSRNLLPQTLVAAFIAVGFEEVYNGRYEEGYDKVVLYQKDGKWTHASRIESDEVEYSKFGGLFDGKHGHNIFSGTIYGDEYAFLRRPISKRGTEGIIAQGSVTVNLDNLLL